MDTFNFNINDLPELDNGFSLIKPGKYNCYLAEASVRDSQNENNPKYLNLKFEVEDGEEVGRSFFVMLNCFHKNEQTRNIAGQHLRVIMQALGIKTTRTTDDLVGARLRLTLGHRTYTDKTGEQRTDVDVKKWELPVALGSSPAAAPTSAPASSDMTPPWKR